LRPACGRLVPAPLRALRLAPSDVRGPRDTWLLLIYAVGRGRPLRRLVYFYSWPPVNRAQIASTSHRFLTCGRPHTPELSFIVFRNPLPYPFRYSRCFSLPDSDNSVATCVVGGCSLFMCSIAPVRGAHRPEAVKKSVSTKLSTNNSNRLRCTKTPFWGLFHSFPQMGRNR
jgi:hypothetical protein